MLTGLREPALQTEKPKMALVSPSLLVREALTRRLSLLGVDVAADSSFADLTERLQSGSPSFVLIDGDGWNLSWEVLIGELQLKSKGIQAMLLASSLSFAQALGTPALGIRAVILKPFKPEDHIARIYEQLLEMQAVPPRRAHPRYIPDDGQSIEIELLPEGDWVVQHLPVLDISAGGARIELPDAVISAPLSPGSRGAAASLLAERARASITFRVAHLTRRTLGLTFEQLVDKNGAFREVLQGFDRSVFGSSAPSRPW